MNNDKHPLQKLAAALAMGVTFLICGWMFAVPEFFVDIDNVFNATFKYFCCGWLIAGGLFTIGNLLRWKNRP